MAFTHLLPNVCNLLLDVFVIEWWCSLVVNLCSPEPRHRPKLLEPWEPLDLGQVSPGIRLHPPISVVNTRY